MEITDYIQYVVALAFVLALIGILFWALKKFRGSSLATGPGGRRLDVLEGAVIDSKRRLVLVRRDNVEHLLLIGATHDLVVETGIVPPTRAGAAKKAPPAPPPAAQAAPKPEQAPAQAPAPAENTQKQKPLNWKLSGKEHVEPTVQKKKPAAKQQAKTADIRPGEQK